MRIVSACAQTVRWPIAGRGAARGRGERASVIFEVRSDRGVVGLGEAAPLPGMSVDTLDEAAEAIAAFAARVPFDLAFCDPCGPAASQLLVQLGDVDAMRVLAGAPPSARFAIETALLDALARERDVSLAQLLRAGASRLERAKANDFTYARAWPHARGAQVGAPSETAATRSEPSPDAHGAHVGAPSDTAAARREPSPDAHGAHVGAPPDPAIARSEPSPDARGTHVGAPPDPAASRSEPSPDARGAHVGAPRAKLALAADEQASRPDERLRIPLAAVVDDPEQARRAFAAGVRCFKIKLAAGDSVDRVREIAAAAPGARLRIDANRSWPRAEVAGRLAALAELPVDYVEEPCDHAHRLLATALACRIALDESLAALAPDELSAALASPRLAAVILKPGLLGGLSAALALAGQARRAGVAAIASHALEGPVGTAACAELALALGGTEPAGLAAHAALDGWAIPVSQLAADHVRAAPGPGLGLGEGEGVIDLARAVAACPTAAAHSPPWSCPR